MNIEIVTKDDLQAFRVQLLNDIKTIFTSKEESRKEFLRASEVRKLLKISSGTLQNLRISGKLKSAKIGGINLFKYSDIVALLDSENNK